MDGHSSSYTSSALRGIGIEPEGHEGILSGEAHDMNLGKITALVMKSLKISDIITAVQSFSIESAKRGLTCIHCLEDTEDKPDTLSIRFLLFAARALPLRLRLFLQYKDTAMVRPYLKSLRYPRLGGCMAWEMDGSVGSKNSCILHTIRR